MLSTNPGHLVLVCVGKRVGGLSDFLDVLRQLDEHWRPEGHARELPGVRHEAKSQGMQASCQTSHSGAPHNVCGSLNYVNYSVGLFFFLGKSVKI